MCLNSELAARKVYLFVIVKWFCLTVSQWVLNLLLHFCIIELSAVGVALHLT